MPRIAKRKTRVLAKCQREGELKAEVEHEYKSVKWIADMLPFLPEKYKKNAVLWIKKILEEHLSEMPKAIAMLGMTILVKATIEQTEGLQSRVAQIMRGEVTWILGEPFAFLWGQLTGQIPLGETYGYFKGKKEGFFPAWQDWLISFTVAYMLVEHGGEIFQAIGSGALGLSSIISLLIGATG